MRHGDGVTDAAAGLTCVVGVELDDAVGDGAAVGAADEAGALGVALLLVAVDRGRDGRLDADFVGLVGPVDGVEPDVRGAAEGVVPEAGIAVITCVTASTTRVAWASSS